MRVRHPFRTFSPSQSSPSQSSPSRSRATTRAAAVVAAVSSVVAIAAAPTSAAEASTQRKAVEVRVRVADNPVRTLASAANRPVGVLRDAGVEQTRFDRVLLVRDGRVIRAAGNKDVHPSDTVKLVRIGRHVTFKRSAIKKHTVVRKTTKLAPGRRKVVAQGRPGVRQARIIRWTRNGEHLSTDVSHRVLRAPAPRRVLVGVRARTVPGTAHLNWRGLARCESGGNPRAVNSAGYYGLYQFSVGTWRGVGGRGMPNHASPAEQTYRAQRLYAQRGRSPWPYCGRFL